MKKILYVVSTLKRAGPTNQLFNIVSNLSSQFKARVLTLSDESEDSQLMQFKSANIDVQSLSLGRIQGLFKGKLELEKVINEFNPDVVHSQGLRSDSLLSKLNLTQPWILTSRNYPFVDYPMKFGKFKGLFMAYSHISAMKKCRHLVSCSKSIGDELGRHDLKSLSIQNGVAFDNSVESFDLQNPSPLFITVGSLISRKNMTCVVKAFEEFRKQKNGSLYILGEGPEEKQLKALAGKGVYFTGNVNNVRAYLLSSDYFISASLSEGLPNTVLEGLAAGLPCLLSDIPSHKEIALEDDSCVSLFRQKDGVDGLLTKMLQVDTIFTPNAKASALTLATETFSAVSMSMKYQQLYSNVTENNA